MLKINEPLVLGVFVQCVSVGVGSTDFFYCLPLNYSTVLSVIAIALFYLFFFAVNVYANP